MNGRKHYSYFHIHILLPKFLLLYSLQEEARRLDQELEATRREGARLQALQAQREAEVRMMRMRIARAKAAKKSKSETE